MTVGRASLSRRLLVGASVFIAAALIVTAIVIAFLLHRFIQGQIDQRLDTQIGFIASMLNPTPDGTLTLSGDADGPPFDRPGRGWYWQVMGTKNVLRSRSLDGALLDMPAFHAPPEKVHPAPADSIGPGGEKLHFRILQVTVGDLPVTVLATAPRAAVIGPLSDAMLTLAISLAALWVALILAILLQVRLGLRPLERLRRSVAGIRVGQEEFIPIDQPAEVLPLVTELNALLQQNEANLERARRHVANLAHGLKTPLATLAIALSESGGREPGELQSLVTLMERRIRHHLARARSAALTGTPRTRTEVAPHIAAIGDVLMKINMDNPRTLALRAKPGLSVACEQQDFDEMIGNLLENAFQWARSRIAIEAAPIEPRLVIITIDDDGPGLRSEQIPEAVRPGMRVDETAPGFGFGLPIARELAELYGGDLTLDAAPLGGLRVTLRLPAG